jgi:putative transposase
VLTEKSVLVATVDVAAGDGYALAMMSVLGALLLTLHTWARSRAALQLEVLALRHQLHVLQRSRPRRLRLAQADRWLWVVLSRVLKGWRTTLVIVKPETVIAWHRRGFRLWWAWRSRRRIGRPTVPPDIRTLIREMANANPAGVRGGFMANS